MKNLILLLSFVCLFACKKEETPQPVRKIGYVDVFCNSLTTYSITKNDKVVFNYTFTNNDLAPIVVTANDVIKVTMSGNTINKTIKIYVGSDTLASQTGTDNPFVVTTTIH